MKLPDNRLTRMLLGLLRQGSTPTELALTVALGIVLGLFPVLGTTTILCGLAAFCFRLNQPLIQVVNYAVFPLQIGLLYPFIRLGMWVVPASQQEPLPESLSLSALRQAGGYLLAALTGWATVAGPALVLMYVVAVQKLKNRLSDRGE